MPYEQRNRWLRVPANSQHRPALKSNSLCIEGMGISPTKDTKVEISASKSNKKGQITGSESYIGGISWGFNGQTFDFSAILGLDGEMLPALDGNLA